MEAGAEQRSLSCPSAQPDMEGARIFGLVSGTPEEPRISYLARGVEIEPGAFTELLPVTPTQVFRFAAQCEGSKCAHFGNGRCSLAQRLVEHLDEVVDALPQCQIRPSCRWFAEQGGAACRRCPQVISMIPKNADVLNAVARPV